jgi:hypothetical protein
MPTIGNAAGGCSASRSAAAGFGLDRSADRLDGTFALLLVALAGGLTIDNGLRSRRADFVITMRYTTITLIAAMGACA